MKMIVTCENWEEMIAAKNSGIKTEIGEDVFEYFLEVLPPVYMGKKITLPGGETRRVSFGFAEGAEEITAFWKDGDKFYMQKTGENNRC